ncbi:MAG: DUF1566 domain-containing protein [Nitrospinaceae bacterium]|nr:DUF1566 domain-containing protein [Nitrospinaceae bacterium]NIR57741.1 DUF1566 domain-containing protein [Nitrospinaceae bacterium]NIS88201.1 DUF1566 domain-containing protein [Nitrospinaceae bacterium]NIT85085.1 DUF1566 domain-containing protein [Nitrospinaceae bacterium]NIU47240.1 DUF1566 domain-containing protein [Nitrospinaceae bacterium]
MEEQDRFKDNENGTLTDTKYNLMWVKEDSWLMRGKWITWKAANKFVEWLNEQEYAGYSDWRLPSSQECRNLYDHECKNTDFNGDIVHIDYKFPEGCGSNYWCAEENGINAMAYNFYSDRAYLTRKKTKDEGNMSCRPVRTAGPKVKRAGRVSLTGRTRRE